MENDTAQLQNNVTTPVTNAIPDTTIPSDFATTDLGALQASMNQAGSDLNLMGEALAKDVQSRQALLIGNNFGPTEGSPIGDINYDRYYEQGLATGANAIRTAGANVALNEGMRRAREEAEKRAENAKKKYSEGVARQQAAAAQAQQQAAQQQARANVQNIEIDAAVLKKNGVSSASDLYTVNPKEFERQMKLAADIAAGIGDDTVWHYRQDSWYSAVDAIYKQFGASSAQRQDERTGNQTQASKDFWKRKDVGDAFSSLMLSNAGKSPTYYQERNDWVNKVNNRVQELIKTGGPVDKVSQALSEIKFTTIASNIGNQNAASTLGQVQALIFKDEGRYKEILGKLNSDDRKDLEQIRKDVDSATRSSDGGLSGRSTDQLIGDALSAAGHREGAAGLYNRALELASKSGILNNSGSTPTSVPTLNIAGQGPKKMDVKKSIDTITLDGASILSGMLGLSAEDIVGISNWRKENPAQLDRYMRVAQQASSMPIFMADNNTVDLDGNKIEAGTIVISQMPGADMLPSYERFVEILQKKPVIYDDATGAYGWADMDDVDEYANAYLRDAEALSALSATYGFSSNDGIGKAVAAIIANQPSLDPNDKSRDDKMKSAVRKLQFGGVTLRDFKDGNDIITKFESLSATQKRQFFESLVRRAEYDIGGDTKSNISKDKFFDVVGSDISADDAQGLLILMHQQQNLRDEKGKPVGMFRPVDLNGNRMENLWGGALLATQENINFMAGAATGLFSVPIDLVNKLNGNASKPGYKSNNQLGYEIATGDKGVVKYADGFKMDLMTVRELENLEIFSGFGGYFSSYQGWRGAGEAASFLVGALAGPLSTKAGLAMVKGGVGLTKITTRKASEALKDALVLNAAKKEIKNAPDGVIRGIKEGVPLQTKAGAGSLDGVDINSTTREIVEAALPASAGKKGIGAVVEGVKDKLALGGAIREIRKTSDDTILRSQKGVPLAVQGAGSTAKKLDLNSKLSWQQEMMFKNASRAQLTHYGATEAAYNSASRWTRATATAMYNGGTVGGRKAAADLINHAHKVVANGGKFTADDAFRLAAKSLTAGGVKGVKALNLLAHEAKWTAKYVGWEFRTETGNIDNGKYAKYLDDDGNFDFKVAAQYQGSNLLMDVVVGSIGYGLAGPAMRSIQVANATKKLNSWGNIMDAAEEGSKEKLKAMYKVEKWSRAANKMANQAGAKFITEGNSVAFRDLANQAEQASTKVMREVTAELNLPVKKAADGSASLTVKDAMEALASKISFKESYKRTIASIKNSAGSRYNSLKAEFPTLGALSNDDSIRMLDDLYTEISTLPKGSARREYLKKEIEVYARYGVPESETRAFRAAYDADFDMLTEYKSAATMSITNTHGEISMRSIYHATTGVLTPEHANIPKAFAGIDISAGIASATRAEMKRESIDFAEMIHNARLRLDGAKGSKELKAGEIDVEFNSKMANLVDSLHAYRNKLESDMAVDNIRNSRFKKMDVIKILDDEVFDSKVGAITKANESKLARSVRRAKEYKSISDAIIARLTFVDNGGKATLLTEEGTRLRAEKYLEGLVGGDIGPSDIKFLKSIIGKKSDIDSFLEDYTALGTNIKGYEKVYKQLSKDNAVGIYTAKIGEAPTDAQVAELDEFVDAWWDNEATRPVLGMSNGTPKQIPKVKTDATLTAADIAEDAASAQYDSPAAIFNRIESAKARYLEETSRYNEVLAEFNDTMFNEQAMAKIAMTSSEKLNGQEFSLYGLTQNSERIQTILATAPNGLAKKIEAALRNSTVKFSTDLAERGKVDPFDVREFKPGDGFLITLNPKAIRASGGSIEATLGHEAIHVYDMVDFDTKGFDRMMADSQKDYALRQYEGRGHAFSALRGTEAQLNKVLDVYDNMLRIRKERLPDLVIAAEKTGVNLDYMRALENYKNPSAGSVYMDKNGITYMRKSDFDKSELSSNYEVMEKPKPKRGAKKDDSEFSDQVKDSIKKHIGRLERENRLEGNVYVDRNYGDMIKTYQREGGEAFGRDSIYAKIGDAMNEIQQLQLAAGYSVFNAYTSRQFLSVLGSTIFTDPKQALKLFNVYGHAGSAESVRRYFSTPEYAEFLTEFSLRSGDTSIMDAVIDVYSPNDAMKTGVLDQNIQIMKDNMTQARVEGGGFKTNAAFRSRGTMDQVHRVVDDPTFKRFLPVLMMQHAMNTYKRNVAKTGRRLDPGAFGGDKARLDKIMDDTYDEWMMFWELNVGTRKKKGGIKEHAVETSSKFLSGEARGTTFGRIASSTMFALKYRFTQATRFLNGLAGINPANWKDTRYTGSRNLLFSGLALMVAAQTWNYMTTGENTMTDIAAGNARNDGNDLWRVLTDFGSMGRFNIGEDGAQIDPFFSVFTMQNSIMRESMAGLNMVLPPGKKLEGVQSLGQELGSLLLSPLRAMMDIVGGTYYGYSVWGKNASAIDPETNEPIPYSPLDNAIAISAHLLGLDNFGIGAGLTYDGDIQYGKNARGENITGSGLLQHEYIDAFKAFVVGDAFEGISAALELPLRKNNIDGRARVSLNKYVVNDLKSFKREYDNAISNGNPSNEDKDRLYQQFAEKSLQSIRVWNDRYKVIDDRPALLQSAQRVLMGFLSDEFDERDNRIKNAYWAAGIGQLGGFDQKPGESDEEYEKRSERVRSAYSAQMDKQFAARQILSSLGYKVSGSDYEDMNTKIFRERDSINFQIKNQIEKGIDGQSPLKAIHKEYSDKIRDLRNRKDYKGAEALEAEYISKFDEVVGPYIKEYGAGILIRNYDFTDIASKYAIIPSSVYKKYSGENGKKYWLQDRYGVGYKDNSALISDTNYMQAYDRLMKDTLKGNVAAAKTRAEEMIKNIANGRYTVSDKQYNSLVELFNKLRNNQ